MEIKWICDYRTYLIDELEFSCGLYSERNDGLFYLNGYHNYLSPEEIEYLYNIKPLLFLKYSEEIYIRYELRVMYQHLDDYTKPKLTLFQKLKRIFGL